LAEAVVDGARWRAVSRVCAETDARGVVRTVGNRSVDRRERTRSERLRRLRAGSRKNIDWRAQSASVASPQDAVPAEIVELAGRYKAAIIEGDVVVPTTEEELATFEPVGPDAVADFESLPPRQDATPTT